MAFGDLDRFKALNDLHGHATGDKALRLFSHVLRSVLRPNDLVGRYGGEEFVVALPGCGMPEAFEVLERLRAELKDVVAGPDMPDFTVSFGLTEWRAGATFHELVGTADSALLQAKAQGRNPVVVAGELLGDGDPRAPSPPQDGVEGPSTKCRHHRIPPPCHHGVSGSHYNDMIKRPRTTSACPP